MALSKRIVSLDYLRGICAFAIMIYHYLTWSKLVVFDSSDFLKRLGIYGVSIFYILSGLTLFLVYEKKFKISDFFVKRFFRIFPLLWVVTLLSAVLRSEKNIHKIVLNLTGLFGFLKWEDYIGTGVWSIGNELVFYAVFPLIFIPLGKARYWIVMSGLVIMGLYIWFAFVKLDESLTLTEQWRNYINPLNQIGLFFLGIAIGYFFRDRKFKPVAILFALSTGLGIFLFYPTVGDPSSLVTDHNRMVFTIASLLVTLAMFKLSLTLGKVGGYLKLLGETSYSLYLLHPLVWFTLAKFIKTHPLVHILVCVPISLILSFLVYVRFELPFIEVGKIFNQWISNRNANQREEITKQEPRKRFEV